MTCPPGLGIVFPVMNKPRTKNISFSVLKDALGVCGSIYSLNAPNAVGYLFNSNKTGKQVSRGTFYHAGPYDRDELDPAYWDGYINFKDKTMKDLISGEVLDLSAQTL